MGYKELYAKRRKERRFRIIISALVVFAIVSVVSVGLRAYKNTADITTITVTDKQVKRDGNSDKYLIFSKTETLENTDSLLFGKFNSSDVYGRLEIGKTYTLKVVGWRNQHISQYRNIVEVIREVQPPPKPPQPAEAEIDL